MEKVQVELSHGGVTEYSSDGTAVEVLPASYIQNVRNCGLELDQSHVTVINLSTFPRHIALVDYYRRRGTMTSCTIVLLPNGLQISQPPVKGLWIRF